MSARRRDAASASALRPRVPAGRRRRPVAQAVGPATAASPASDASAGIDDARRKRKPRFVL